MKGLRDAYDFSDLVKLVWAAVSRLVLVSSEHKGQIGLDWDVLSLISSDKVMTQTTVFCWCSLGHWRNRVETTETKDSPVCRRQREFGNCFTFDPLLKVCFSCFKPCRGGLDKERWEAFYVLLCFVCHISRLKVGYKNGECSDQTTLTFLTSCVGLRHCIYYLQTVSIPKFPPQGHLNTEQEYGFRFCC